MPAPPQALVLAALVALFVRNRPRHDLVAPLALPAAMACGVVPAERAFTGRGARRRVA